MYIEGRNGNCNVKTEQLATHKEALQLLNQEGIYPKYARMDSGSYSKDITDFFDEKEILFCIRANRSEGLRNKASALSNWEDITIGTQDYQVNELPYEFGKKAHRIIAYRGENETGQIDLYTQDNYNYLFLITNDWETKPKEVISFYNARGESEQIFDRQNNDFGWKAMPHANLNQNTVFLIITALAHVVYRWLIIKISPFVAGLTKTSRVKKFIFRFINTVARVTRSGRRRIVTFYCTTIDFTKILNSS